MRNLGTYARNAVGWVFTMSMAAAAATCALLGGRRGGTFGWLFFCQRWARALLRLVRVRIHLAGGEHLAGPAVFCANHQTLIDIVFLPAILPRRLKWVAKRELLNVPIWGWALASGAVFIDRSDPSAAIAKIRAGVGALPRDWSVCIFPEGTRSHDGRLGTFKKGAAWIALQTGKPIVPVGFWGAQQVVAYKTLLISPGDVEVTVGAPISTDGWREDTVEQHLATVRDAIQACVDVSRQRWESAHAAASAAQAVGDPRARAI